MVEMSTAYLHEYTNFIVVEALEPSRYKLVQLLGHINIVYYVLTLEDSSGLRRSAFRSDQ